MPGPASQYEQEAAILRVEELAERAGAVRAHVHEIVTSRAFRGSRRSCEFLEYAVEKALAGQFDFLKERTLGVQLFGRDPAYDTSEDAIVRVTASDVRKRLLQFYGGTKTQPPVRIDLPSGSYIVQFRYAGPAVPLEPAEPAVRELVPVEPAAAKPAAMPWRLTVALMAVIVAAAGMWMAIHQAAIFSAANCAPWRTILRRNRPLKIVCSDPNLASVEQYFGYQLPLADYASRRYLPETLPLSPDVARVLRAFRGNTVASVDAATALRVSAIVPPSHVQALRPRTLQAGDFKTDDDFILLGSPISNPWAGLFQDLLDFAFRYDTERHEEVIRNRRPEPGEPPMYSPTLPGWGTGDAYGIAAFVANPNQSGHVMLLSGTNAAATEAAGKFMTNPELVAQTLKAHGMNPYDEQLQFEILLRVSTIATSLNTFDIVACHRLSPAAVPAK